MTTIQWLGTPRDAGDVGQYRLRSPRQEAIRQQSLQPVQLVFVRLSVSGGPPGNERVLAEGRVSKDALRRVNEWSRTPRGGDPARDGTIVLTLPGACPAGQVYRFATGTCELTSAVEPVSVGDLSVLLVFATPSNITQVLSMLGFTAPVTNAEVNFFEQARTGPFSSRTPFLRTPPRRYLTSVRGLPEQEEGQLGQIEEQDEPGDVGQYRLRTPGSGLVPRSSSVTVQDIQNIPTNLFPSIVFNETTLRRTPQLREPPGQWSFEIRVGGRVIGTCGPARMENVSAPLVASTLVGFITGKQVFPAFTFYSAPNCSEAATQARDAYNRTRGAVTIAASRNGVFRFTYPLASREGLFGLPEQVEDDGSRLSGAEEGDVGQVRLRTPGPGMVPRSSSVTVQDLQDIPSNLFPSIISRRTPQLREPPGQWTFAISVGGKLIGTCGPSRMDTRYAQGVASQLYNEIVDGPVTPFGIFPGTILNYPRCPDVLLRAKDTYRRTRGIVAMRVSRNGVFRFTTSSGSIQPTPTLADFSRGPYVAGPPQQQSFGPYAALGAPASGMLGQDPIPWQCWDVTGFKDCKTRAEQRAAADCTAAFIPEMTLEDIEECRRSLTRRYIDEDCIPRYCPIETTTGQTFPWMSYSRATEDLQNDTNTRIQAARAASGGNGLCDIEVDGKLGPITCGAIDQTNPGALPTTCNQHRSEWEGKPLGLCTATGGAVDCPEGQIPIGDKCVTPQPPAPPTCQEGYVRDEAIGECVPIVPPKSPPTTASKGVGAGGIALLAAAALAAVYAVTQVG